jgi:hypothetical protein
VAIVAPRAPIPEAPSLDDPRAPSRSRLRFLGSLDDLVAIALHRPAFERLCRDEPPGSTPIDRPYVRKLLDEQVGRSFGQPLRPIVELVLDGAAASESHLGPSAVDVDVDDGTVMIADDGPGMSLAALVAGLLVPFSFDDASRAGGGRRSASLFSAIGLGLEDPASFSLLFETGDGVSGVTVCVRAEGGRAADAILSLRETKPRRGTRVKLCSARIEAITTRRYLNDTLHFFPKERARIGLDGVPLNDGRAIVGGAFHEIRVYGGGRDGEPAGVLRVHVGGRALTSGITAATYHAGVRVEACPDLGELVLIDFPAGVAITEGRDALLQGPLYAASARALYERLLDFAAGEARGRGALDEAPRQGQRLAELAALVSALMLRDEATWAEEAPRLAEALLGASRFLVTTDRAELVLGFLGPAVARRLFVPQSFWAERRWSGFLPSERDLLEDELVIAPPAPLAALAAARPDLRGLEALLGRDEPPSAQLVSLCRSARSGGAARAPAAPRAPLRRPIAALPCLGREGVVLVREDAPAVIRPAGWSDLYALRVAFARATGEGEPDVERALIVSAPLRSTARPGRGAARRGT